MTSQLSLTSIPFDLCQDVASFLDIDERHLTLTRVCKLFKEAAGSGEEAAWNRLKAQTVREFRADSQMDDVMNALGGNRAFWHLPYIRIDTSIPDNLEYRNTNYRVAQAIADYMIGINVRVAFGCATIGMFANPMRFITWRIFNASGRGDGVVTLTQSYFYSEASADKTLPYLIQFEKVGPGKVRVDRCGFLARLHRGEKAGDVIARVPPRTEGKQESKEEKKS